MPMDGYIDYQRREFCKDVKCPTQLELNSMGEDSEGYERVRATCKDSCGFTTYQFHHWLIDKGYLIVRQEE